MYDVNQIQRKELLPILFPSFQSVEKNDFKSEIVGKIFDRKIQVQKGVKITCDQESAFSDLWGIMEDQRGAMGWKWTSTTNILSEKYTVDLEIKDCQD